MQTAISKAVNSSATAPLVSAHLSAAGRPRPVQFVPHIVPGPRKTDVCLTPQVEELLAGGAAVAMSISGGKDSVAAALALNDHLNRIAYAGPRVLIHSDLGVVEWKDSLPACERLGDYLGWELVTVRRASGDMLDRWRSRWAGNVRRYISMSVVNLILPWSTPSMRFCTSELKTKVITSALKKRFPNHNILNVLGVRAEESANRARQPVSSITKDLVRRGFVGVNWNVIQDWRLGDVLDRIDEAGLELHEAYTVYNSSRLSCAYCIMSSEADLKAAASCQDNADVFRAMVDLEIESTYAFQGSRWLADMAPQLLRPDQVMGVALAKERALERQRLEAMIPKHLLLDKGRINALPTQQEAATIAHVRGEIGSLMGFTPMYLDATSVLSRYRDLISQQKDGNGEVPEEASDEAVAEATRERVCG